jgi:hypothetical protein
MLVAFDGPAGGRNRARKLDPSPLMDSIIGQCPGVGALCDSENADRRMKNPGEGDLLESDFLS